MEFDKKGKAPASTSKIPRSVQTKAPASQVVDPILQRQTALRRKVQPLLTRPVKVQRKVAKPVLQAAQLEQQETQRLAIQRETLNQQTAESSDLPAEAVQQALQRQQAPAPPMPTKPQSVGDWVTVMRMQADQAEGRRMNSQEAMQYTALQRQVANTIAQNFRQDRQPAIQRYEQYGQHLATLQRSAAAPVANVALQLMPVGERQAVQRAIDESINRETAQQVQDEQALKLHSLQRQMAELDHEAMQPVMARIQARRGSGNPLPEAVQRHLEQGLNHDL